MTLALTLSDSNPAWLSGFAAGLFEAADAYEVSLVGGDTTHGPRTVISVNLTGDVEPGRALTRTGARCGDLIFVSGRPGEASAGLALLQANRQRAAGADRLLRRFRRPEPRLNLGARLAGLATAAIDVSDGLYGDAGKLLDASGAGGRIDVERLPLSQDLLDYAGPARAREFSLGGGDDYELCFTARPEDAEAVARIGADLDLPLTAIGEVVEGSGLVCVENGRKLDYRHSGYLHFGGESV